jgi:Xaa-Pro dipeptidase
MPSTPPLPPPITDPPSAEELASRLERVRARMRERGLDVYVSFDPTNVYYLTNFANYVHERPFLLVIRPSGRPTLLAPLLEAGHVRQRSRAELDFATYPEFPAPEGENWFDVYAALIDSQAQVGVESAMPIGIAMRTPGQVMVQDVIDEVRLVKTAYEIGRNVHACQVVEVGHRLLLENASPGVPEVALYGQASSAMMAKIFGEVPDANPMVCGTKAAVWPPSISHDPHLVPSIQLPMEQGGPHVSITTAQVNGYGVELERTFFLNEVPNAARAPFAAMLEARATAYELAKPGAALAEIDRAVRAVIDRHGFGDRILHRTGHGFGITGHEGPYLALGDDGVLEPDMLISIEPGIYIPGTGGFRHSDTVWVTETGCVSLTRAEDDLESLTFARS